MWANRKYVTSTSDPYQEVINENVHYYIPGYEALAKWKAGCFPYYTPTIPFTHVRSLMQEHLLATPEMVEKFATDVEYRRLVFHHLNYKAEKGEL